MQSFALWLENNMFKNYTSNQDMEIQQSLINLGYIGNYYANMIVPSNLHKDIQVIWAKWGKSEIAGDIKKLVSELGMVEHFIGAEKSQRQPNYKNPHLVESLRKFQFYLEQIKKYIDQNR